MNARGCAEYTALKRKSRNDTMIPMLLLTS